MNATFFNRFQVTSVILFLIIVALVFFAAALPQLQEYNSDTTFAYTIMSPSIYLALIFLLATSIAGKNDAVDEKGARHIKIVRIITAALLLVFAVYWIFFFLSGIGSKTQQLERILFVTSNISLLIAGILVFMGYKRVKPGFARNAFAISFFFSLIFLSLLLIVFLWTNALDYEWLESWIVPFILCCGFGAAFYISLILFAAASYWKRAKLVAIITSSLLLLLPFFAFLFVEISPYEEALHYSWTPLEDRETETGYDAPKPLDGLDFTEYAEAVDESDLDDEEIDEPEETAKTFKLDFLWDNQLFDRDSIRFAIEYGKKHYVNSHTGLIELNIQHFQREQYSSTSHPDNDWSEKGDRASAIILSYLGGNRSNLNLEGMYKAYKPIIKSLLTKEEYKEKYKKNVDMLLAAYEDMEEEDSFDIIYTYMNQFEDVHIQDYHLEFISDYVSRHSFYIFLVKYNASSYDLVKYYSFWGRRYHEGNHKAILKILKDIQDTYN